MLRRADGSLQVGLEGAGGVVVHGLGSAGPSLVRSLDGTASLTRVRAAADALGIPQVRLDALLQELERHGHLTTSAGPAGTWTPVPGAGPGSGSGSGVGPTIAVDGCGPAATTLGDLLTRAGLSVVVGAHVAAAVLGNHDPRRAPQDPLPVVVLLRRDAIDAREARGLARAGLAHLPVVLGPNTLLVGPLVASAGSGPCLECLDLTRCELDPGWAAVHAQLLPSGVSPATAVGGDGALDAIAASLTTMILLAHLDGGPERPGVSHEVRLPWPRVVARQWHPHPACSCRAEPGPGLHHGDSSVTMAG